MGVGYAFFYVGCQTFMPYQTPPQLSPGRLSTMPYDVTGYDSAGVLHAYVLADDGSVTGDTDLLTGWLADNPLPPPPDDVPMPAPGEPPSPAQLELIRQHYSKLLTNVQVSPQPIEDVDPTPPAPEAPIDALRTGVRYTAAELNAMTATEVRELATAAHVVGASSMTKAELVTAVLASQGA
jgi:Rho termination factor, N-terminal domain